MLWHEYVMNDHCPEYDYLTIEEKLLVDIETRKWFANTEDLCVPMFIFRIAESRIIEKLKEEDGRRKTRDTNADTRVASYKHNERARQRKSR